MDANSHENAPTPAPVLWSRRFPGTPRTVPSARHAAVSVLGSWGVPGDGMDEVAVVVSELVTNAVTHGRVPGRLVELRLEYDLRKAVTVHVADAGDGQPPPSPPCPASTATVLADSGRGLALVAAFAEAWGVRDRIVGKTVWARVLVGAYAVT